MQPDLQQIVYASRVETLWEMGIAGADLVIACVGAGLRAFTKYMKVEYANGEEVPAEKFLAEVEGAVLDTMMGKLSGVVGGNVAAVDPASRFYVLWQLRLQGRRDRCRRSDRVHLRPTCRARTAPGDSAMAKMRLVEKKKAKYTVRARFHRAWKE